MSKYVMALDQGTTSSRAILFSRDGSVAGVAQQEFRQIFPQPGWVEHDPEEIWASQKAVARAVLKKAGVSAADIAAIGITNQRETTVVWDRATGLPVYNAIVWQDRRTAAYCDALRASHGAMIQASSGLVVDAYFSGSKVRWILENLPDLKTRAEKGELAFGTIDSWLLWRLTGGTKGGLHATDVSNASRTMLFNISSGEWDDELLGVMGVPRKMLPEVRPSSAVLGETAEDIFGGKMLIGGMAGDQQAALFGQACFSRGMAKNTYGTGCFLLMNVGDKPAVSRHKLLSTVAWKRGGETSYALEGSVFIGGAVVQWLRDGLGMVKSAGEIEALARSVPDSGGVYLVPAFAGLGAPHWDQYARGSISGITRGTTSAHLARAGLEAIAFQVADVLEVMREDSGLPIRELRVDGGAAANDLLLQTQANLLGVPIVRPEVTETTALGAAYLAGLAVGFWESTGEVEENWQEDSTFEPLMSRDEAAARRAKWKKALERARDWEEK